MLEAGGAKVVATVPPFQNIAHVTHAFISKYSENFLGIYIIYFSNTFETGCAKAE